MKKLLTFLTLALFGIAGSRTLRASLYQIDDGTAESATGIHDPTGAPTDFIALNQFNVIGGNNMIGAVEIAWGAPFVSNPNLNGLTYTAAIWSDPNNDGDPSDAVLLAQASGIITNASTNTFDVTLFNCVTVTQSFFVGFLITENGAENPGAVDLNGGYPPGSFVAAASGGSGDITSLTSNNLQPVTAAGNVGIAGNFLIRADPWVVPEPRSDALVICGGMIALLVWRRRVGKLRRPCPKLWPFAF